MKKTLASTLILAAAFGCAATATAADKKVMVPIENALNDNNARDRLGNDIQYFFGAQKTPKIVEKRGTDQTNQKTNAFGKSDEKVCHWAFLSAMLQLEKRARELGANAVVNIRSNYKNVEYSSETEFECHVGNVVGGVALKADFARIGDKK